MVGRGWDPGRGGRLCSLPRPRSSVLGALDPSSVRGARAGPAGTQRVPAECHRVLGARSPARPQLGTQGQQSLGPWPGRGCQRVGRPGAVWSLGTRRTLGRAAVHTATASARFCPDVQTGARRPHGNLGMHVRSGPDHGRHGRRHEAPTTAGRVHGVGPVHAGEHHAAVKRTCHLLPPHTRLRHGRTLCTGRSGADADPGAAHGGSHVCAARRAARPQRGRGGQGTLLPFSSVTSVTSFPEDVTFQNCLRMAQPPALWETLTTD